MCSKGCMTAFKITCRLFNLVNSVDSCCTALEALGRLSSFLNLLSRREIGEHYAGAPESHLKDHQIFAHLVYDCD